jgi:hypothetical protein
LLVGAEVPDDEEAQLVLAALELLALDLLGDLGLVQFHDALLDLEEAVELPVLDAVEKRREDVHVHIEHGFPFSQSWEQSDRRLEVLRAGACVVLQVFQVGHAAGNRCQLLLQCQMAVGEQTSWR